MRLGSADCQCTSFGVGAGGVLYIQAWWDDEGQSVMVYPHRGWQLGLEGDEQLRYK